LNEIADINCQSQPGPVPVAVAVAVLIWRFMVSLTRNL
jgi:hypothetical protein